MKKSSWLLILFVWWVMVFDRTGEHITIESRWESTCRFYEKLLKRVPTLKVTDCTFKESRTEIG